MNEARVVKKVHNSKSERFHVKSICQLIYKEDKLKNDARYRQPTEERKKNGMWNITTFKYVLFVII
jgi:hypothetical protein